MSRIGNAPIQIPDGVTVTINPTDVKVTGPKGELSTALANKEVNVKQDERVITVSRSSEEKAVKAYHGLIRSLINNMVIGVTEGYKKQLEVNGVGYKININGQKLKMALGYSHDIEFEAPEGVAISNEDSIITIEGIDKQQVGQTAAQIRSFRKPEPYKGKGIKYVDEHIIRKAGKAAATAGE